MFKLRPFRGGDLVYYQDVPTVCYRLADLGPGFTLETPSGYPAGSFGATVLWTGVIEVWTFASPRLHGVGAVRQFTRAARNTLTNYVRAHDIRRVQAHVQVGKVAHARWAEHIGLKQEAYLDKYGPEGQPYWLYVLFPEGNTWLDSPQPPPP